MSARPTKLALRATAILAVLTISGVAFAGFTRDLSGLWNTPQGKTVVIVHDVGKGKATFTFAWDIPIASANRLAFRGEVYALKDIDAKSSPNDFMFGADMDAISFVNKKRTCTLEGQLDSIGTVLGQAPNRKLQMACTITAHVDCDDGTTQKLKAIDCGGMWN